MTVISILKMYLEHNDFDGLFMDNECGCLLDDLVPCESNFSDCTPGYKTKCDCSEGCDFHIVSEVPKITESAQAKKDALNLIRQLKEKEQ